jgi:trehalose-phosphatase
VTGRAIESITVVGDPLPQWYLVGSHGIEVVTPEQREGYTTPRSVPGDLIEGFELIVARHPGSRIELKPFGVALHTRGVPDAIARAAESAAHALCSEWGGDVVVRTGHGIVECAVKHATKGDGLSAVRLATGAEAVFFAGDDLTDEDGFAVMQNADVAIRVGGGETIAPYRLDDAYAVAEALWLLHETRAR